MCLVVVLLLASFSIGVMASNGVKNITATLKPDVTVIIDGVKQDFIDANGNRVYPIIYNGTTYLPLRSVAQAVNKSVDWNGTTQTVTLGEKNAYVNVVSMSDKGSGYAGSKVVAKEDLTFPYGDFQENKTFGSAIRLKDVNSAIKEFVLKLDGTYSTMSCIFHSPKTNSAAITMEIKDADTDVVLASKKLEPGNFIDLTDINLNGAKSLEFAAQGSAGSNDFAYFLEPKVK